jgi:hypothetical protein
MNPFDSAELDVLSDDDEPRTAPVRSLRGHLAGPRDVRDEIAFQNEVNGLLAVLSAPNGLVPVAPLFTTPVPRPPRRGRFAAIVRDTIEMAAFPVSFR